LFVHVEGPGRSLTNADHAPARPFEWWRAGQYVRYTTTFVAPRVPGHYTVWVGLFDGPHRAHVTAPHGRVENDAFAAATFEVVP
jgi:hypothetical protein